MPPTIEAGERILWVTQDNSLNIDCIAHGTPNPTISWWRDGEELPGDATAKYEVLGGGTRLLIRDAKPDEAGRYTCKAINDADEAAADFIVEVATPPVFYNIQSDVSLRAERLKRLNISS